MRASDRKNTVVEWRTYFSSFLPSLRHSTAVFFYSLDHTRSPTHFPSTANRIGQREKETAHSVGSGRNTAWGWKRRKESGQQAQYKENKRRIMPVGQIFRSPLPSHGRPNLSLLIHTIGRQHSSLSSLSPINIGS